jgi:hypothetical protein
MLYTCERARAVYGWWIIATTGAQSMPVVPVLLAIMKQTAAAPAVPSQDMWGCMSNDGLSGSANSDYSGILHGIGSKQHRNPAKFTQDYYLTDVETVVKRRRDKKQRAHSFSS